MTYEAQDSQGFIAECNNFCEGTKLFFLLGDWEFHDLGQEKR